MKLTQFRSKTIVSAALLSFFLAGCSTLEAAYEKTKDTVSGWFKPDSDRK